MVTTNENFISWLTNGFRTFSCNIFKWFLISETSSSVEAEESSDDVRDFA